MIWMMDRSNRWKIGEGVGLAHAVRPTPRVETLGYTLDRADSDPEGSEVTGVRAVAVVGARRKWGAAVDVPTGHDDRPPAIDGDSRPFRVGMNANRGAAQGFIPGARPPATSKAVDETSNSDSPTTHREV